MQILWIYFFGICMWRSIWGVKAYWYFDEWTSTKHCPLQRLIAFSWNVKHAKTCIFLPDRTLSANTKSEMIDLIRLLLFRCLSKRFCSLKENKQIKKSIKYKRWSSTDIIEWHFTDFIFEVSFEKKIDCNWRQNTHQFRKLSNSLHFKCQYCTSAGLHTPSPYCQSFLCKLRSRFFCYLFVVYWRAHIWPEMRSSFTNYQCVKHKPIGVFKMRFLPNGNFLLRICKSIYFCGFTRLLGIYSLCVLAMWSRCAVLAF